MCEGQFERKVEIIKKSIYATVGKTVLIWSKLEKVLLHVKVVLDNKLLSYAEDHMQMPILTPNAFIYESSIFPEDDTDSIIDKDFRKQIQFIKKCKEIVWLRWKREYFTGLLERHKAIYGKEQQFKVADVVIIKEHEINKAL